MFLKKEGMIPKIAFIILAAGSSSRLGQPKQLVSFEGCTLIERVFKISVSISPNVQIVLGANADLIKKRFETYITQPIFIENPYWQQGMGTSIRTGVNNLNDTPDAVLILLSDQPAVSMELLQEMIQHFQISGKGIVACRYAGQLGVPMLFDKKYLSLLASLQGDKGAKAFLHQFPDDIQVIDFEAGSWDIDTPDDLASLSNKKNAEK